MNAFNLWEDEEKEGTIEEALPSIVPSPSKNEIIIEIIDQDIHLYTLHELKNDFENLIQFSELMQIDDTRHYTARFSPVNAFVLRKALKGHKATIDRLDAKRLGKLADTIEAPKAYLDEDKQNIKVKIPSVKTYKELMKKVDGYPTKDGYTVNLTRVLDLEALTLSMDSKLPPIQFDREVLLLNRDPIIGFDGTLESLKHIPTSSLNIVKANKQSWKSLKSSNKTIEEKLTSLKINNLYDLLFDLPRRHIDKSNPRDIDELVEGETAVVIGKITEVSTMSAGRGGAVFKVKTDSGRETRATFFNQAWLTNKFKTGDEVLVTGKFSWWNHEPQIGGASIEHASEVSVIPIVPVYNQSPTKGITTTFIMSANRELLSRLGNVKLPPYFRQAQRMDYCEALSELHFPSSLQKHTEAMNDLAYYELVYMQMIIQEAKEESLSRQGISLQKDSLKLQPKAIKTLPFEMTKSQKLAVVAMNKKTLESNPTTTLLNADVGAGKSLVAQLACLKAVSAGYQAVLVGPTEILAKQLYAGFTKLTDGIKEKFHDNVEVVYLSNNMKAAEKRVALKKIKEGEANIIVGTHSLFNIEYYNLGFIAIDEQQKFGAEQRSKLLNARADGLIPHILIQTATPIPRSTAQVIYGDIDMLELKEKPPGRIPIVTEWIQQDPNQIIEYITDELWVDIIKEAEKGNQTFIITPLISESSSIDSASVERTYKSLSTMALSSLRIGYVHGKMKSDEQAKIMEAFRNKEYDVLVASTVIEVGVDIPDATRVIILSADRLGSSQLHQIRGRVGRNSKPSKCYLVSLGSTENSQERMNALVEFDNGFDVAKSDLRIRGTGKMFSTEQSGKSELIFSNLLQHSDRINEAKEEAQKILHSPFREQALKDSFDKFESNERLI